MIPSLARWPRTLRGQNSACHVIMTWRLRHSRIVGRGRGSSSKSLPNAMRHIVIIRTHLNHASTPLPKPTTTLHLTPSKSSQLPPQIPLPQRPAGEFAHILSQRFVRVILASGHASMALGTLLVFVLAGNNTPPQARHRKKASLHTCCTQHRKTAQTRRCPS